jgi:hypothetical protein
MSNEEQKKRQATFARVKESVVSEVMGQSDEQILADAAQDGINPDEMRSRVLDAFRKAKQTVSVSQAVKRAQEQEAAKKPTVLDIDAARARAILKRVASRTRSGVVPLPIAAQLDQIKGDEAIRIVSELKDMGVLLDDELK